MQLFDKIVDVRGQKTTYHGKLWYLQLRLFTWRRETIERVAFYLLKKYNGTVCTCRCYGCDLIPHIDK